MAAKTFQEIMKFNPYHDAKGRFASGESYATGTAAPGKKEETMKKLGEEIRHEKGEKGFIIDDDGTVLFSADGGAYSVDFTGAGHDTLYGKSVLHNHPDDEYGGTFSHSDVILFTSNALKETRVVAAEGTYILRRGEEAPKIGFPKAYKEAIDGFTQPHDWQYSERGRKAAAPVREKYEKLLEDCDKKASSCYRSGDSAGAAKWEAKYEELSLAAGKEINSALRREFVKDNNAWLAENAPKYNFQYEFIPTGSTNKSAGNTPDDSFSIYKTDDDKRLVFGWASIAITVDGEQLEDRQKDIIDPEDLEEAAYEYVLNFRDTGEEHISSMRKKGKLVESCVFTVEKQKAIGIPEGILPVGWWIGFKIDDDAAWERVKNGTYRMFSIEGKANRIPVEKALRNFDEFPEISMWYEENMDATEEDKEAAREYYEKKKKQVEKSKLIGCGVLVVQDGKILSGTRIERGGRGKICGPGGHIEPGEAPEEAAKREAWEEFGITCEELTPLGTLKDGTSAIFLCTKFSGTPKTDEEEMTEPKWRTIEELREEALFGPFEASLEKLPPDKRQGVAKTFSEILKFNPYHDAKGRFATSNGYASFTIQTKDPKKQHWADLAIARMKQQAAANPPAPPKPTKNYDSRGFADYDDADYHQLYNRKQYFQQQQLTPAQKKAADAYVDPNTEPGSLYNVAQNLNWAMVNGHTPAGKHKQVYTNMMDAMHNIGYNVTLTRYDHSGMVDSLLSSLGAGSDYTKLSMKQIQKALVGQTLGENKFISTTTNDFGKAPSSAQSLFKNRAVKINYNAKANVQGLLMPIGSGGDQGEMVLAPTNGTANKAPKITAVRSTGKTVYRAATGRNYPQIEIDLEWD